MNSQTATITKLEKIENEILKLKKGSFLSLSKKTISLRGVVKNVEITDQDIEKAEKSLFKEITF